LPSDRRTKPEGLPSPPRAQGQYQPAVVTDALVMTAGMTPRVGGVLQHVGRVGDDVTVADARTAAAIAAANAVSAVSEALGSLDRIDRGLRMTVYVNAVPGFTNHSQVADGASDALRDLLGDRGAVARSAVGVSSLPGGACVEVELTCGLVPPPQS
jgi:enamine deaminase RidA (YjgF/YER057c/UK114 family)